MEGRAKNQKGLLIEKNERENPKQLVGRFLRHLRQSGILRRAKGSIYKKRPLSHGSRVKAALRRQTLQAQHDKLEKLGKA